MKPYGKDPFPRYDTDERPNPQYHNRRIDDAAAIAEGLKDVPDQYDRDEAASPCGLCMHDNCEYCWGEDDASYDNCPCGAEHCCGEAGCCGCTLDELRGWAARTYADLHLHLARAEMSPNDGVVLYAALDVLHRQMTPGEQKNPPLHVALYGWP